MVKRISIQWTLNGIFRLSRYDIDHTASRAVYKSLNDSTGTSTLGLPWDGEIGTQVYRRHMYGQQAEMAVFSAEYKSCATLFNTSKIAH